MKLLVYASCWITVPPPWRCKYLKNMISKVYIESTTQRCSLFLTCILLALIFLLKALLTWHLACIGLTGLTLKPLFIMLSTVMESCNIAAIHRVTHGNIKGIYKTWTLDWTMDSQLFRLWSIDFIIILRELVKGGIRNNGIRNFLL